MSARVLHSVRDGRGLAHIVRPERRPNVLYDIYWCGRAIFARPYPVTEGTLEVCRLCRIRADRGTEGITVPRLKPPGPKPGRLKIHMPFEDAMRLALNTPPPPGGWLKAERAASLARQAARAARTTKGETT